MVPHAIDSGAIKPSHREMFQSVKQIVGALPNGLNSDDVCDAIVAKIPELRKQSGWFGRKEAPHSWLILPGEHLLIDPYPIASGSGPLMVSLEGALTPWRKLYTRAGKQS